MKELIKPNPVLIDTSEVEKLVEGNCTGYNSCSKDKFKCDCQASGTAGSNPTEEDILF